MSLPLPPMPLRTSRADDFIAPMAKASLLVCVACSLWFTVQMLALPSLLDYPTLVALWGSDWWPLLPEPVTLGIAHAEPLTAALLLLSMFGAATCWGLLRFQRWALVGFTFLLVLTALLNFIVPWLLDLFLQNMQAQLAAAVQDPDIQELRASLRVQRAIWTGLLGLAAIVFFVLHLWLVQRLWRADVRARFFS
ncbi:hypothetical protein ACLB90_09045 [Stenotrophomonas sp. LGBM10]|uniref:hypothetical protein n=1 Tax=Stenotrophomonas sp. LGBM10 TaxID=3390038 RepID=UPI00398A8EFD